MISVLSWTTGQKALTSLLSRNLRPLAVPVLNSYLHASARRSVVFKSQFPDVEPLNISVPDFIFGYSDGIKSKYGENIAVSYNGENVSYNQLKKKVYQFAQTLQQDKIAKRGDTITVALPNSVEYIVGIQGGMASGATLSPINPTATPWEISYQIKDNNTTVIITDADRLEAMKEAVKLAGIKIKQFIVLNGDVNKDNIRSFSSMLENEGDKFVPVKVDCFKDVAILPYSSGTTGSPKGVMLSHVNLVTNVRQALRPEQLRYNPDVRCLALLPFYHIYGLATILLAGLSQGTFFRIMTKFEPKEFLEVIQSDKLTTLPLVPPIAQFLAKHPMVANYDLSSVTDLLSAAAPLAAEIQQMLSQSLPGAFMRQGYGMTETGPLATLDLYLHGARKIGSVGPLISSTLARITDIFTGEELGVGETGELCIKGPQIMLGYHNNDAANKAVFDNEGWFHTGDIAKADEDGHFYIVDRLKELIKVKGFQVAPAELEAILLSNNSVADACVVQKVDAAGEETPMAFVVLKSGHSIDTESLKQWTNNHLSKYKHITDMEYIDVIPRSPAGKILRRVLRDQVKESKTAQVA